MQGERNLVSTMAENVSIDHASMSSDVGTDPQLSWNSMQTSAQNRGPDYGLLSSETNNQYLPHVRRDTWNADWTLGESSASQHQHDQNGRKTEHTWTFSSRSALSLEEHQSQPSNNMLALDNAAVNSNANPATNGTFHLQNSSYAVTQDLNMSSGFSSQEDAGGNQGLGRHSTYFSVGSSSEMQSAGCSSSAVGGSSRCSGHMIEDRPGGSLDGRRLPCKRKASELNAGQSSGVGSSNCVQNAERSQWHNMPAAQIPATGINVPTPTENNLVINNGLEHGNPMLRLGIRGAVSASPFSLTTPSGNVASSRRNCRLRINGEEIVGNTFSAEANVGNMAGSSSQHARSGLRNHFIDLNPSPAAENGNPRGPSVLHIPSIRRNHQTRWTGASSTRASTSSSSAIPEEWNAAVYEEPTSSRNIPRSIAEHPMFIPASEMGNSSQNPINWNMVGGNNSIAGNIVSVPRVGSSTGISYSAPGISHRNSRRLSELVRRSLLSSTGTESASQNSTPDIRSAYQEMVALPHRPDNHRHRAPNSRPLLDRHGAFAVPYSLRSLAAASEGRSGVMSEQIRHVLDLVRRGEGLRLEDVMLLNHSVFAGMAEIHDRHRDMRLDVDNMSYEELLALEEHIGDVCTGLSEETIMGHMRQHSYVNRNVGQAEIEPCSICREEYNAGEDIGTLDCGHDFHRDCIKEWLQLKNLCPICKTTGLNT